MNLPEDENVDWSIPIWEREEPTQFWDPSRRLIRSIRKYQALKKAPNLFNKFRQKLIVIEHRFWSIVTGAEIDLSCQIGGGFLLPHANGVVIHPACVIGPNCMLFQQVTLAGTVNLGYHVDIGAGAKILGPLNIGNNIQIGANAVVTKDIPDNDIVVGIPAYSIKKK